jgi:hypothetical protein
MYIEGPVFVVSKDNTTVGCYRTVDRAERTLTRKVGDGLQLDSVLVFDGLARPVEARQLGGAVKLAISQLVGDPWQVRARAQEAISHKLNEFAAQGDSVVTPAGEFPKDVVMERLGALRSSVGYDVSFHEFALALVTNLDPSVLPDSTDPYRIRVCKWLCWCCDS